MTQNWTRGHLKITDAIVVYIWALFYVSIENSTLKEAIQN